MCWSPSFGRATAFVFDVDFSLCIVVVSCWFRRVLFKRVPLVVSFLLLSKVCVYDVSVRHSACFFLVVFYEV